MLLYVKINEKTGKKIYFRKLTLHVKKVVKNYLTTYVKLNLYTNKLIILLT